MSKYQFSKKTSVILRAGLFTSEKSCEGYTVDQTAFPFAIVQWKLYTQKYWIVANRFSGKHLFLRFAKKREAERFFQKFSELYDIFDIDFFDPLSKFDYRTASFIVSKAIKQENYLEKNFKEGL